jgi:tetratricopeptide (TPR) repeat protein
MRRLLLLSPILLLACQSLPSAPITPPPATTSTATTPTPRAADYSSPAGRLYLAGNFRQALPLADAELAAVRHNPAAPRAAKLSALALAGNLHSRLAQFQQADQLYIEALSLLDPRNDADQLPLARCYLDLARLHTLTADFEPALDFARKSLAIRRKLLPAQHPDLADAFHTVGTLLTADPDATLSSHLILTAHADLLEAWKIRTQSPDSRETAESYTALGNFFLNNTVLDDDVFPDALDDDSRVERCLNKAFDIRTNLLPKNHPDIAESLVNLANFDLSHRHLDDAADKAVAALAILEYDFGPNHPDVADTLNLLGRIRAEQNRYLEAEAYYTRAEKIFESAFHPNHYFVGIVLKNLADLYSDLGDKAKVKALEPRLDRIRGRDL